MEIFSLKDKVALVTGALGLLGKEHCRALSEAGANVIVADLNGDACSDFAKSLVTDSIGVKLDVTDKSSVYSIREIILDCFGKIDVLVNNAAINDMLEDPKTNIEQSKFENYPLEAWQRAIDVNLTGVFLCSQVIGTLMSERGSGSIINIASTYGIVAPNQSLYKDKNGKQIFYKPPAYSVTKGAVISFSKYLASYWGTKGIRINSLSPGGVENGQDDFFKMKYSQSTPIGRMAKSNDYMGALIFLASDASQYMTGANLVVDGGWTSW
jgi:NAD(P)-dependent dehydrogenase (short-subunit alcohol dehydrogenase family)